jgi:predicted nucleic acid-binding protein
MLTFLDRGERDAILVALELKADLLLMDDREGVEEAVRLGLVVTGTLGVLDRAAEKGLVDLADTFRRLRTTNFRVSPALLDRILADNVQRKRKGP